MPRNKSQETSFVKALNEINIEIKPFKVAIEQRGGLLCLRATLPVKDGKGNKQQRISLKIPAQNIYLKIARDKAIKLAGEKASNTFNWDNWTEKEDVDNKENKIDVVIEKFKEKTIATGMSIETWNDRYLPTLGKFHKLGFTKIDEVSIIKILGSTPKNSYQRREDYIVLNRLAKFLRINILDIKQYRSSQKPKPRRIPSDDLIIQVAHSFDIVKTRFGVAQQWKWVFCVCAVYGLRPSEVFYCEVSSAYPYNCYVHKGKTGERTSKPLYPEWAEKWELWTNNKPKFNPDLTLKQLGKFAGRSVKRYFKNNPGIFPDFIRLYDLRHAYAIRGSIKLLIPVRIMAKLMGHSSNEHLRTYSHWLSESDSDQIYLQIMNKNHNI